MKTKRIVALLAALVLFCCLLATGCGRDEDTSSDWLSDEWGDLVSGDSDVSGDVSGDDSDVSGDNSGVSNPSSSSSGSTGDKKPSSSGTVSTAGKTYMDDELDDWTLVFGRSTDLKFDSNQPAVFEGDASRVVRNTTKGDFWFSYKFEGGITEFGAVTYWDGTVRDITVSVSKDGKTWTKLTNASKSDMNIGYGWTKRVFKYKGIDKSNKYVKVELGNCPSGDKQHSPNIGHIRINNVDSLEDPNRFKEDRKAATFYVDSKNGSDSNDGLSQNKPLKSLNAVSKHYYQPGDKILFKSGCTFNGSVTIHGVGDAKNPIQVGTYGGSAKAKIAARGGNAIQLKAAHVSVENLEITNATGTCGIYVIPVSTGKVSNITVKNCYLHDINTKDATFANGEFKTGAILCIANGAEPTWFDGVTIENNTIENVARLGIGFSSDWAQRGDRWGREGYYKNDNDGWWPMTNVVVRGNTVNKTHGDSITVFCTKGALIENNTVTNSFCTKKNTGVACAALWTTNSNDSVIQYNDVSYTNLPAGCADGEAFDIDIAEVRTTIQYNYAHNNEGGFLLMCNTEACAKISKDHTIRFNLSVNDGSSSKLHGVLMIESANPGTKFYNNTFYMNGNTTWVTKLYSTSTTKVTSDFTFTNNIFYGVAGKSFSWPVESGVQWKNTVFDNNVFCNAGLDKLQKVSGVTVKNAKTDDPKFANPSIDVSKASRGDAIKAFTPTNKLKGASNVANNGGKDIAGNKFSTIDFYGCVKY